MVDLDSGKSPPAELVNLDSSKSPLAELVDLDSGKSPPTELVDLDSESRSTISTGEIYWNLDLPAPPGKLSGI
jgi:hypothetical protein